MAKDKPTKTDNYIGKTRLNYRYFIREKQSKEQYAVQVRNGLSGISKDGGYYYSYSYHYDWLNTEENILGECRFGGNSHISLTENSLRIYHRKRKHIFKLGDIKMVQINFKRLIAPLVIGGIAAPLALLAIFNFLISLWVGFSIAMIGGILFYYGFRGTYELRIEVEGGHTSIFVDESTDELTALVNKANAILPQNRFFGLAKRPRV